MYKLKDGDYLRVGNCIYRFLMGGNVETEYHEEIYRLTIIDGLTEIHNKRYLMEFLDRELARSSRHNRPLVAHHDRHRPLQEHQRPVRPPRRRFHPARIRPSASRETSARKSCSPATAARNSPIVLPETHLEGALIVGDRILKVVSQTAFLFEDKTFQVTISAGVATTQGEAGHHAAGIDPPLRRETVPGEKRGTQSPVQLSKLLVAAERDGTSASRSPFNFANSRSSMRSKLHAVAGAQREISLLDIDEHQRRAADDVPAAGRDLGVDAGLPAGQADAPRLHLQPRRCQPRHAAQPSGK